MLFNQIKEKLDSANTANLTQKLGYKNPKNFEKTITKFLNFSTLHEWFKSGNYDFVNQPHEFFTKLSFELDLDKQTIKETLEKEKIYINEEERFRGIYIYANTNFSRKNEPIAVLAFLEKERCVSLYQYKELFFKSTEQILEILSKKIKEHYETNKEGLVVWGKIVNYQVHLEDKIYLFDTDGILKENVVPVFENKATLALK